ncbi:hypothetical protein GCM10009769_30030 [Curtobacterium luteum]|uniref:Uncharacterized protein n=1 Tax=Curtobacterium luteum TaxID=33881 RepID=A0A8H9L1E4_9MICO|nr:hypothetical protein GCM10009769_30030 [Curtobacterium luteum]
MPSRTVSARYPATGTATVTTGSTHPRTVPSLTAGAQPRAVANTTMRTLPSQKCGTTLAVTVMAPVRPAANRPRCVDHQAATSARTQATTSPATARVSVTGSSWPSSVATGVRNA